MSLVRVTGVLVRVAASALLAVAVGVSVNQVLNNGNVDGRWLGAALLLAAIAEGVNRLLPSLPPSAEKVDLGGWLRFTHNGTAPQVDAVSPVDLGVKQPIDSVEFGLNGYVARDFDIDLVRAVQAGGIVVLSGAATAGKTRAAAALLRTPMLAGRRLWVPTGPGALRGLVDAGILPRDTVIWLDDLEGYIGPDGIDEPLLERICPLHRDDVAVLATIREDELVALLDSEAGGEDEPRGPAVRRPGARLLARLQVRGRILPVSQILSESERARAAHVQVQAATGDSRIADAVASPVGFGEYLIAGPALMARWTNGTSARAHLSRAFISAAVDCRRAGFHAPVPGETLADLASEYLPEAIRERSDLPVVAAWQRAQQPVAGTVTSSCLTPLADNAYRATDYLLDQADRPPSPLAGRPIPPRTWPAVAALATAGQKWSIAIAAWSANQRDVAEAVWRQSADEEFPPSMVNLGAILHDRGEVVEAERLYRRSAEAGFRVAAGQLGDLLVQGGELEKAKRYYRQAVEAGYTPAIANLGVLLKRQGSVDEAESLYRRAIEEGHSGAMNNLGNLLCDRGNEEEAESWYHKAAEAGVAEAMVSLSARLKGRGEIKEAEHHLVKASDAGFVPAMLDLGDLYAEQGAADKAERILRRAVDLGSAQAMNRLGKLFFVLKRLEDSEPLFLRAAAAGSAAGMFNLGMLLKERDDLSGARRQFQRAADAGHAQAMFQLGRVVQNEGDLVQAERLFLDAIEAGLTEASYSVGRLRYQAGDVAEAERYYRRAAEAGVLSALNALGVLRMEAGDSAAAAELFRQGVEAGDIDAVSSLAVLRMQAGDSAAAEQLFRRAIAAGDINAVSSLGVLLHRQNKLAEAERLLRQAAKAGHVGAAHNLRVLLKRQKRQPGSSDAGRLPNLEAGE